MKVEIYFFIGKIRHAFRSWHHVPRKGDLVELKDGLYQVTAILWADSPNPPHRDQLVHLYIKKVRDFNG